MVDLIARKTRKKEKENSTLIFSRLFLSNFFFHYLSEIEGNFGNHKR